MTQNLRLVGPFQPDKSDSDVTWTKGSGTFNLPDANSGTDYNGVYVFNTENNDYGVYYSWTAVTAGTGTTSMASGDASSSICPKGWRLPTGASSGEWQTLYNEYPSSVLMRSAYGPGLVLSGYRLGTNNYYQGNVGRYWTSTAQSQVYAFNVNLESSAFNADYNTKNWCFPVRCVAR